MSIHLKLSLRRRFIKSIGLMLLPLIVLGMTEYILFTGVIKNFEEVRIEALEEMYPVLRLQTLMHKAAMPPNDYLIHGKIEERNRFDQLAAEVDKAFEEATRLPFKLEEERVFVDSLHRDWFKIKELGVHMFSYSKPVGNPKAAEEMELFDSHIDRTEKTFSEFVDVINKEVHEELKLVHAANKKVLSLIITVFIVGVVMNIGIGFALARSVLIPVRELEMGTERFASGELSYRIPQLMQNELGRLAGAFNKMAEKIEMDEKELKELSIHDGLTGLFNKREFESRTVDEVARSKRYNSIFSLIMLDIDHFKAVNDTYGHQAGDHVLKTISNTINSEVRSVDFVARYGGEEMAVILPNINGEDTFKMSERLRKAISSLPIPVSEDRAIHVTVSMGIATFPDDADTGDNLIRSADEALYNAKKAGRNQVSRSGKG